MVQVDVGVAGGVDEVAGLQAADVGYHHREQCVRGYVERDSEEGVGAALIELAGELSFGHIELEQAVARRRAILSTSPGFQAVTSIRLESGLFLIIFTTWLSWSIERPSGAGQERHWWP